MEGTRSIGALVSFVEAKVAGGGATQHRTAFGRVIRMDPVQRQGRSKHGWLVHSPGFKIFIDMVIILNIIQMGIALDVKGPGWNTVWRWCETLVAGVFFFEMILRVLADRVMYFASVLNIIDFVVAWTSLIDLIVLNMILEANESLSPVQILRLVRLVRIAKLLRVFPAFRVILESMRASLQAMFWLVLFMFLVIYVASITCVMTIGKNSEYPAFETDGGTLHEQALAQFNNYMYFGTIWRSMLTLFNLTLLSEVSTVLRATNAVDPWSTCIFSVFILVMTLCLLNTIIGVIVEKTVCAVLEDDAHQKRSKARQMEAIEDLAELMFELDEDGNYELDVNELQRGVSNPRLHKLLRHIDLPVGFTAEELFNMLDLDGSGKISRSEFIGGIFRLIFSNDFQRQCLTILRDTQTKKLLNAVREQIIEEIRQGQQKLVQEIRQQHHDWGSCEKQVAPADLSSTPSLATPILSFPAEGNGPVAEPVQSLSTGARHRREYLEAAAEFVPELKVFLSKPIASMPNLTSVRGMPEVQQEPSRIGVRQESTSFTSGSATQSWYPRIDEADAECGPTEHDPTDLDTEHAAGSAISGRQMSAKNVQQSFVRISNL